MFDSVILVEPSGKFTLGGSSAEKAGVRLQIVQALSGVGSCWVVRESYAYEKSRVTRVR